MKCLLIDWNHISKEPDNNNKKLPRKLILYKKTGVELEICTNVFFKSKIDQNNIFNNRQYLDSTISRKFYTFKGQIWRLSFIEVDITWLAELSTDCLLSPNKICGALGLFKIVKNADCVYNWTLDENVKIFYAVSNFVNDSIHWNIFFPTESRAIFSGLWNQGIRNEQPLKLDPYEIQDCKSRTLPILPSAEMGLLFQC